jgi:ABC-type antimicrobial peptide transport system permease subunit
MLAESMALLRAREMGIRAALGAKRWQLGAIVLAETGRLVGLGLVAGFALAWLGANTIRAFLFQVQPFDAPTLVAVCVLILALAAGVTLRPALRAARVDLASVLRDQ